MRASQPTRALRENAITSRTVRAPVLLLRVCFALIFSRSVRLRRNARAADASPRKVHSRCEEIGFIHPNVAGERVRSVSSRGALIASLRTSRAQVRLVCRRRRPLFALVSHCVHSHRSGNSRAERMQFNRVARFSMNFHECRIASRWPCNQIPMFAHSIAFVRTNQNARRSPCAGFSACAVESSATRRRCGRHANSDAGDRVPGDPEEKPSKYSARAFGNY